MPIFNQQTNLSGQGNFAPGVTYYAGIKAPSAPAVHLPKANASFNLDLSRIGDAMIQASRDKRETDIAIAKIDAAKKEQAAAAAEKQLKLDMTNAHAQEIADVVAQVDQGLTDPIAANRMIKTINDKYFSYGILSASEMASNVKSWDGGITEYQEKTREQLRQSNISREENTVTDLLKYVPSAANLPRSEQLMLAYNLQNTDLQLDDAIGVATANPTEDNMTVLQNRVDSFADMQAGTFMSNYLYSNSSISTPNIKRNFIQALDEPLRNRGVNSQMRAYALHKQLERYGPLMTEMGKWSEDTLKYYKNTRQLGDEMFKLAVRAADPVAYYEHEENNVKYKLAPDERISTSIDPVTGFQRQSIEIGNYTLPKPVARSSGNGEIVEATEQVPVDAIEYLQANKASPTLMSILYGQGHVPVGPFGRARSDLTVAGTYNDQVVVPGRTLYNPATTGEQISNAYSNNANYMRTTKDNPLAISNMTEQDNYDGTNNVQQLNQRDRRFAYNTLGNPQRKAEADVIYNDNVLPFSESGEFAAFRNSVVMDPVSGNLTMLNTYEKGGVLTPVAQRLTASRAKTALRNINDWTGRVTQNPEQRAQLARSFFDGEMNIPDYAVGMGGASLQTSKSEKTAEIGLKSFDVVSEWFNKLAVDTSKKYFEGVEKATTNYLNKDIEPEYQEALKVDPTLTRSQFLYNKVADYLSENLEKSLTYLKDKMDQYDSKFGEVRNRLSQRQDTSEKSLNEIVQEERDWDFQRGTVDVRDPSQLPIHIFEDGSWGNLRYGTITSDGRTYVVPGFDEEGNVSDNRTEFDKGRYFFSIAGDDKRAEYMADGVAKMLRQYIIDRDGPAIEALMNPSQAGIKDIIPEQKKINTNTGILKSIADVNEALNEVPGGFVEGVSDAAESIGGVTESILSIGKLLAYNKIAHDYGFADAQQMLEQTDTPLAKQITIPLVVGAGMTLETITDALEYLLFSPSDLKPVTFFRNLFKNDQAGLFEALDDLISIATKGNVSNKTKAKMKKDLRAFIKNHEDADVAYYQNYQDIL